MCDNLAMEWAWIGLTCLGVLGSGISLVLAFQSYRIARRLPHMRKVQIRGDRADWPRLSVVIAACNEAQTIEPALQSLLSLDYPALEILVVNDRSTDATGAILDRLAAENPRLEVVHNQSLPEGWLGKVHALHLGTQAVNGEWLLFTDADVHFAPGCLQRAITLAENQELDYIAAFPQMLPRTFWLQTVIGTFGLIFLVGTRSNRVNDPRVDSYVGVGAFNLVKRSAFDRTPGFEWLRLEIADDVGLGMMLKRAGARGALVYGLGCLAVEWYPSLGQLVRGLEKNAFSAAGFSWPRLMGMIAVQLIVFVAPFLLLLPPVEPWEIALVVLQLGTLIILGEKLRQWAGLWWVSTFFLHLALPIICWAAFRSGYKVSRAGGVSWRGTFYGLDELRGGRRLEP